MNEEKNLTDEEIVRILEECFFGDTRKCCECKLYNGEGLASCMKNVARPTLDLIHRLQGDKIQLKWNYVELKERYVKVLDLNEKVIAKQKAEIERLTEEKNEIWDERNRICKGYWETMDECKPYRERNAELQKQVDELKEERENIQKILYELGKCGNDKERYAVWVKLIKYCGVEVE